MQRLKKSIVWLSLFSLIMGMFPLGTFSTANAAGPLPSTTYFAPEELAVLMTANLNPNSIGNGSDLRTKVKVTNSPTISISGTYSKVSGETLSAQIDLMSWDSSLTMPTWVADKVHSTPGIVMKDSTNDKRFNASSLTLFPGLNRITFKGNFGNLEGSETFYVLYDKIPYFSKLSVMGSGFANDISLNEGARVVVKNPQIYLAGDVFNSTKATVSVNGGSPLQSDIYDNKFTTSPIKLNPGLNKLSIKFTNGSDSIEITRDVYYFTDKDPVIGLYVIDKNNVNKGYDLLNNVPVLKDGPTSNDLIIQMMLPYSASIKDFGADNLVTVDGVDYGVTMLAPNLYDDNGKFVDPEPTAAVVEEVIIDDSTGPIYRLVTFKVKGVAFQKDGTANALIQKPKIQMNYGEKGTTPKTWNYTAAYTPNYKVSDKTTIKSMKYLPDYTDLNGGNVSAVSKLPLNNASVAKSEFYIMVETDGPVTDPLKGKYLPLGTKGLSISTVGVQATDAAGADIPNTFVYKVSGFATGEQKVRFEYTNSLTYDVTISYSSISGILVDNLQDGQTYTFNSSDGNGTTSFDISGEYFGFANTGKVELNPEYFINGLNIEKEATPADYGTDTTLVEASTFPKFKLSINISSAMGPLVAGENTIEFRGQYRDAAGNLVPVSKKLRIYIVDENVANLTQFHPAKVPVTALSGEQRALFPTADEFKLPTTDTNRPAVDEAIQKVIAIPTEFTFKDDKFTTSEQSYDLVLRGSGASKINLLFGTDQIFTIDVPEADFTTTSGYYPSGGSVTAKYFYEIVGNSSDFLLRIRNNDDQGDFRFDAESTGTHVYNLELINKTGARSKQRLEIVRELAPYRLLAPQPTVGDQYVVNKNFIRFDIEAEGATKVIIGKQEAVRRSEPDKQNRFTLDYVGLKPDKSNSIKIQIVRGTSTINDTINVFYTSQINIDTQFMAEKIATKYSVFNKKLELSFPKGAILQSANLNNNRVTKYYPDTKLLFGIADPKDGVVERRNDYGIYIDKNTEVNNNNNLLDSYKSNFTSTDQTFNFTRVSDIYWISGGVGELGDKGTLTGYKPATNGLAPYSTEGIFTAFEAERKVVPSQRGTLKLSFNQNVVDEAGTLITVFKYTEVDGQGVWARVPGEVNTKAHTITIPFDEFGYYAVYKLNRSFSDITNHPWARNILNALYSKGIMDYLRADAFGADDQTTRGEFATLLVKGLGIAINTDGMKQSFFDVPFDAKTTTWDFEHLETASRAGIITGRTEGFFSPNMPITRQDAAVMIARALKLKLPVNDQKLKDSLATSFLDSGKIDYYAIPAIQAVTKAKIMSGSPITLPGAKKPSFNFNPTSNMTRAEAGKIAVELLKKSTNIFPKNFN